MLGKVIKNEFKDTWKVLLPLNLALVVVTICGLIALNIFAVKDGVAGIVVGATSVTYMLGLIALVITSLIYLAVRFYKSMYGSEGYLTHTLPVSAFSNLHGKLIVSILWYMFSMVLAITSVLVLAYALVANVGRTLGETTNISMMIAEFEYIFEAPIGILILKMLGYLLMASMSALLMIYASLSIGQLFNKYKIGAAVVTYIIFYLITQIISFLIMLASQMKYLRSAQAALDNFEQVTAMPDMTGTVILSIAMIVIYYGITAFICNRKLNLD